MTESKRLAGKAVLTSGLLLERSDTTCGHKARDITPLIFLERAREGHRQSDEHWNRFNAGEPLRDGVERIWAFLCA